MKTLRLALESYANSVICKYFQQSSVISFNQLSYCKHFNADGNVALVSIVVESKQQDLRVRASSDSDHSNFQLASLPLLAHKQGTRAFIAFYLLLGRQ